MSMDCYCDYEPADVYQATVRKARKEHSCDECGGKIISGDKYENVFGVWEGTSSTWKTCQHCRDIRTWVQNNVPCLCWAHGNTMQDCRDAVDEAAIRAPEETKGLRFGFLRRVTSREKFYAARRAQVTSQHHGKGD
jgi:hypothetical protein